MGPNQVVIRDFAYPTRSNFLSSPVTVPVPDHQAFEVLNSPNEGSEPSTENRPRVDRIDRIEDGSYWVRVGPPTSGSVLDGPAATLGIDNRMEPSLKHYRDPNNRDYPPSHVAWIPTGLLALPIMIDILSVTIALISGLNSYSGLDFPGVNDNVDVYIGIFTFVFVTGALIVSRHITRIYNYWAEIILDALFIVAWSYVVKIEANSVGELSIACFLPRGQELERCEEDKGWAITLLVLSSLIWILFAIYLGVFAGYIDQHRRAGGSDIYKGAKLHHKRNS